MSHDSVAVQSMLLVHALSPHSTLHVEPPHRIELVQAALAQVMSQLEAFEQSIVLVQPMGPQSTRQGMPTGHVRVLVHFEPTQSKTHVPAEQVPPQADDGHRSGPVVEDEPHAEAS